MIVLDTDVLSQFVRKRPSPRLIERVRDISGDELFTTVISVMELRYGSARRTDHEHFWQRLVREVLSRVRLLVFDSAAALRAGDVQASLEATGQRIGLADVQIAAIVLERQAVLVTGNVRHFERVEGLAVENWLA